MTGSSDATAQAMVGDVVRFRSELFFEGAVQLRWFGEDRERALKAASHFVFHGPRYHGVGREDATDGYALRDTASFTADLVETLSQGEQSQGNPFSLAIAGYGSGKSHLAITLAELLSSPNGDVPTQILRNVSFADAAEGKRLASALDSLNKPVLAVPLDGMTNFNLGAELTRSIIVTLRDAGCDLAAIEELSPRFKAAERFVARNFELRSADFAEMLPGCGVENVIARLREHDETTYSAVDTVFERANGAHIPVEGRESVQDLIATVTAVYCSQDGPFSGLLILFDEFGRFLEYAAEQPHLAGDSALQQLFQGVQDSAGRAHFLGFIQYDLKAYVSRLDRRDLMHLQRYITRFEAAQKFYLSTNLETLFAHLIEKRAPEFLEQHIAGSQVPGVIQHLLNHALPDIERFPVWHNLEQFREVICTGCWPLDPLAVWFLTRQQDVVQSRSALNIVKSSIERVSGRPAFPESGGATTIAVADLLLADMLPEFVAAEQARGGSIAETLQAILEERGAQLEADDRRVLAGAAALLKLRVRLVQKDVFKRVLLLAAGVGRDRLEHALQRLVEELGVLEWNDDFGQYELIQDAATRGQFTRLLRSRGADPAAPAAGPLFITHGRTLCNVQAVDTGFANSQGITTHDWHFEPVFADSSTITDSIAHAFKDWKHASDVNEAKGRIIYAYIDADEHLPSVRDSVCQAFDIELKKGAWAQAPVWVALLHDTDERLSDSLRRWWVLERGLNDQEKERYRRFVSAERDRVVSLAQDAGVRVLTDRLHEVAGFEDVPTGRLSKVGQHVFASVYPQVVPFPFDGFGTATGAGTGAKKDCLEIARALFSAEADAEWIQSRGTRLRNRATKLLVHGWRVLNSDGKLAARPDNDRIAAVIETLERWHQEAPGRSLEDTRRALIAPPYGCTRASAAVLLGLLLARRWPRRRLLFDGQPLSMANWIGKAFKASDLDAKVLARTTVGFIADDAQARWGRLLEDWRNAERHRQRIEYKRQAKLLEKEGAVPEEYLYQYERLVDQARQAQDAVMAFEANFEQVQRELEDKFQNGNSLSALAVCDRLLDLHEQVTSGAWEAREIEEVERILSAVREWVAQEAPRWIERAHCRSPQEVSEYRHKMEKAAATCKKLELAPLAEQVERQKTYSIATVEERFEYQSALAEARQFARVTTVSPVATIRELEAVQDQADRFVETLGQANEVFPEPELDEIIEQLGRRRREAGHAIASHRAELRELYEASIDSLDAAQALQTRVAWAREVFAGQRDIADIEDARRQLEKICADLKTWSAMEGSPENIETELTAAIDARCAELEQWCEAEEVEPLWPFRDVYWAFCKRHVDAARERSALWARSFVPSAEDIDDMSLEQCRQKLQALERERPTYLAATDLGVVERSCDALRTRIGELEEEKARAKAKHWLAQFDGVAERVSQLSGPDCKRMLHALRTRPAHLNATETECVERLTEDIERRLDEIDVSDILARIRRLKPESLRRVAEAVASMPEKV